MICPPETELWWSGSNKTAGNNGYDVFSPRRNLDIAPSPRPLFQEVESVSSMGLLNP